MEFCSYLAEDIHLHYKCQLFNSLREVIVIYNEKGRKYINTVCEQNVVSLNVEADGTYSNCSTLQQFVSAHKKEVKVEIVKIKFFSSQVI